jgi:hypothetical protein
MKVDSKLARQVKGIATELFRSSHHWNVVPNPKK